MVNLTGSGTATFEFSETNYTILFNTYWKGLYAIAYRRLRDADLAKDIVQDLFVYCWQQRETIRINTSIEAYLRSALQYRLIAHFRKLDVEDRAFTYLYDRMVEVEASIKDNLAAQDLGRMLDKEFEQMPDTMREIFKLRSRDYSVNEIAENLNLAEKTVRNNITRGLQQLRTALSKESPEDYSTLFFVLYILLT
ncbi:RNA polymerase sigma factor [Desertivirga xinjiangensis]|uniref:RNA polymerase sigma factor n=1 Tax=Desertivirga xinjiangensis TaxID=539206 RepID=UPI00210EABBC|nr:sigma-70 family RNA polymerase sigma factor [Pedobacter xinjiangensis]